MGKPIYRKPGDMYTESGEKEASKRRKTKRRGTTEEREFQTKAATMCAKIVERSARRENFGGARRENSGNHVKKKKRYA